MNQLAVINAAQAPLPTIIGQVPARFPIGGRIRAGIKVLTQTAASHPEALMICEAGVKAGKASKRSRRRSRALPLT